MKTFNDLEFKPHKYMAGEQAEMEFENGYGVSVLSGGSFYSDGVNTFELAVLHNNTLCYSTPVTSDVEGYKTADEVTALMKQVQELPSTLKATA